MRNVPPNGKTDACRRGNDRKPAPKVNGAKKARDIIINEECDSRPEGGSREGDVLVELAVQLETVVDRLRGAPIGHELEGISRTLHEQANKLAGCTATDLARRVGLLVEEREELRLAFKHHMDAAAKRGEELQTKCEALREEAVAAKRSKASTHLHPKLAAAMRDEAKDSKAARTKLTAEWASLQAELEAEQQALRCARAELVALQALRGTGVSRSRRVIENEDTLGSENGNNTITSGSSTPMRAGQHVSESAISTDEQFSPREPTDVDVDMSAAANPQHAQGRNGRPAPNSVGGAAMRRSADFAKRDFTELFDFEQTLPPWRAEIEPAMNARWALKPEQCPELDTSTLCD